MIWAILAFAAIGFITWVLIQWKAGAVAGEHVKKATQDVEAAARIGQILVDSPHDKRSVVERLSDPKRQL